MIELKRYFFFYDFETSKKHANIYSQGKGAHKARDFRYQGTREENTRIVYKIFQ